MTIWRSSILPNYSERHTHSIEYKFACRAFLFLASAHIVNSIVIDLLSSAKVSNDATVDYLYHLSVSRDNCVVDESLKKAIYTFVLNIDSGNEIIIAGNIYHILNGKEKILVKEKILLLLNNSVKFSIHAISSSSHFITKRADVNLLKQMILNSQKLWDNGLRLKSASPCDYIRLSSLNSGIKWTRQEVIAIYLKLNKSLKQLLDRHSFDDNRHILPMRYEA